MMIAKMANMYMPNRNFVTVSPSGNVPAERISEPAWRGKSAIKPAAIFPCSRCADDPPASAAIDEANLLVAASRGNRSSSAASCQGSISSRANVESTLSGVSFLSFPIIANSKKLNSDATEAERVISAAKSCFSVEHEFRTLIGTNLCRFDQSGRNCRIHLGNRHFGMRTSGRLQQTLSGQHTHLLTQLNDLGRVVSSACQNSRSNFQTARRLLPNANLIFRMWRSPARAQGRLPKISGRTACSRTVFQIGK
jgi:hypothetical protein